MSELPNVLVFGGLDHLAPNLIKFLLPETDSQPLVGYLRVADRFSINPPTTYVPKDVHTRVEQWTQIFEYRQANLHKPEVVAKCFDDPTPNGRPFTHIFDFTGELGYDRPAEVHIANTFMISLSLAHAAAQRNVKAYIRAIGPWFDQADPKKKFKEEEEKGWKPAGLRGVWWAEMLRAVGSIPGLPLVVLRSGMLYGPGIVFLEVTTTILLGLIYKRLNQEMKFLWSPKIRKNTCHIVDMCAAMWTAAEWISLIGRAKAIEVAGAPLHPTGDKSVSTVPEAIPESAGAVIIPIFNVVDESDTTQESMTRMVGNVFGIKTGSHGSIISMIQGLRMKDVQEDVNELHMEQWAEILQESTPPAVDTPLSPYILLHTLEEHGYAMDGEKIKRVLKFQHQRPHFTEGGIREFIRWCRKEGIWPESSLYVD